MKYTVNEFIEAVRKDIPDIDPQENILCIVNGGAGTGSEWLAAYQHLLRILLKNQKRLSPKVLEYLRDDYYWNELKKNQSLWKKVISKFR